MIIFFLFFSFESKAHYIALAGLEIFVETWVAWSVASLASQEISIKALHYSHLCP